MSVDRARSSQTSQFYIIEQLVTQSWPSIRTKYGFDHVGDARRTYTSLWSQAAVPSILFSTILTPAGRWSKYTVPTTFSATMRWPFLVSSPMLVRWVSRYYCVVAIGFLSFRGQARDAKIFWTTELLTGIKWGSIVIFLQTMAMPSWFLCSD